MSNPAADMRPVKKEEEDVPCGELNECMMDDAQQTDILSNMQPISCATNGWDSKIDRRYMMLLDSCREDGDSYPRVRDNPLRCIRYEVDNGGYDKREMKLVTDKKKRSREDRNTVRVTKKNDVESKRRHVQATSKKTAKEAADSDLRPRERSVVTDEKSVEAMLRNSQEARDKDNTEDQMVVPDESYRAYLTRLVEKSIIPRADPEKEIQVKREEEDTMSLPGSDIIAVGDRPFEDEEESPFVPSKSYKVTDLEEESDDNDDDQRSSWFRKEITNILKQPYNEKELLELKKEASERRSLTRCRELRDGRDIDYATEEKGPSYLDKYPIFKRMLKEALRDKDRHRALNLLRGFIFYLTKVVRHDAFKPWRDRECLKIM
uniref:Uncharacterized protein n=1 Tax=Noccaea caerulescens TaxID=107243 RepID=A0A1J3J1K1_NOCCA